MQLLHRGVASFVVGKGVTLLSRHPARALGINWALEMVRAIVDGEAPDVPPDTLRIVEQLSQQVLDVHAQVQKIERDYSSSDARAILPSVS